MAGIIAECRKGKLEQPVGRTLLLSGLLALPDDEEQPRARLADELLGPIRVRGQAVTDLEGIALYLVDAFAGLALVLSRQVGDVNLLRLLGGIQPNRTLQEDLITSPGRVVGLVTA